MSKRIVIIGGMGPQANVELHRRIISKASELGAKNGDEFPEILNLSIPIADFISSQRTLIKARDEIAWRLECFYTRRRSDRNSMQHCTSVFGRFKKAR